MFAVALACADDGGLPPLGDTGTGGGGEEQEPNGEPLPAGPGCGPNWYDIDGEQVPVEAPEPGGGFVDLGQAVEFTGPPLRPPVYAERKVDPSFAGLSFAEFARAYARPYGSDWFIEGDQAITDADLHALHESLVEAASSGGPTPVAATYAVGGYDAAWSAGEKLAITWCLGRIMPSEQNYPEDHAANVALAIETMEWATRAWERAADVNFIHLSELDSPSSNGCRPGEDGVDIRVRTGPECLSACGGLAFPEAIPYHEFDDPDEVEGEAEIILGLQRFFWSPTEARINALHELGHVMGLTHEDLRWEQEPNSCDDLASILWRGLTPPDPDSVMGIDSCVGINPNQPRLSAWDRLGAYYSYNWGHRRALVMAAASQTRDYVYDGEGRTGIVWQRSRSPELEVWTSTAEPGQPISFSAESVCAEGGAPPCEPGFDSEGRVRSTNAFLTGTANDLDLLFNGPGPALGDLVSLNDAGAFGPLNLDLDSYAVPVVGSFGPGIGDQVFLYRPGPAEGALLVFEGDEITALPMNYEGYAYPLAARYRGFGGGGNDILWYDPHEAQYAIWQWSGHEDFSFIETSPSETGLYGLERGVGYVPILGDFNGDARSDIFWYAAGPAADTMWWSTSNQDAVLFTPAQTEIDRDYRPFTGDFDANGVTDILWFAPHVEVVGSTSQIWYFDEDESFVRRTLSTNRDYSPYVADFDSDGCSDILWYRPDDPQRRSPIWRCVPEQLDFACDDPILTPEHGYPVGFGGAY